MPTHSLIHTFAARIRTMQNANVLEVHERNSDEIVRLCKAFLPSGSGFDSGSTLDIDRSTPAKLVFETAYHHMNDAGMYDGWTQHRVTVIAEHDGFDLKISGRDRNQIKDYIADVFSDTLKGRIDCVWDDAEKQFAFYNEQGWLA
jgi:hypothetical protein